LTSVVPKDFLLLHSASCHVQETVQTITKIALIPKIVIDLFIQNGYLRQGNSETEFGFGISLR
jgi:hypothetical protein